MLLHYIQNTNNLKTTSVNDHSIERLRRLTETVNQYEGETQIDPDQGREQLVDQLTLRTPVVDGQILIP